jgi:hypothetical protein
MRMVSIDPGLSGTGVAMWSYIPSQKNWELDKAITKSLNTGYDYLKWLRDELDANKFNADNAEDTICLIEEPTLMESEKGTVAARSGALVKLSMYAGMVVGLMFMR